MSEENVEVMRRGFELWNAGEMDALRELFDPVREGRIVAIDLFWKHAEALEAAGLAE
jgi:ketosteroid isomerase-like protein